MRNPIKFVLETYVSHETYKAYMNKPELRFISFYPSQLQDTIESIVTNGLGYEPRTSHEIFNDSINNTPEGLQAHLAELNHKIQQTLESELKMSNAKYYAKDTFLAPWNDIFKPIN